MEDLFHNIQQADPRFRHDFAEPKLGRVLLVNKLLFARMRAKYLDSVF